MNKSEMLQLIELKRMGVSGKEMAEVLGFSEGRVSQVLEEEEFKRLEEREEGEKEEGREEEKLLDEGWDALEREGLGVLLERFGNVGGVDEEFALRAATLANKARRRGSRSYVWGRNEGRNEVSIRLSKVVVRVEEREQREGTVKEIVGESIEVEAEGSRGGEFGMEDFKDEFESEEAEAMFGGFRDKELVKKNKEERYEQYEMREGKMAFRSKISAALSPGLAKQILEEGGEDDE